MSRALALVDSLNESQKHQLASTETALLETKLYVPRVAAGLVPRQRLVETFRRGTPSRLTVVVAPAGFGKTTLLTAWLAESPQTPHAWVSLEAGDNDPAAFWAYVIRALQKVHPDAGVQALSRLQSLQPATPESILTTMINEIDATERDFTLVLDDYHVIESAAIHEAMTFLVDHLPRRLRLVIASRAEPPLALARLRARGELTEVRAADLRFTGDETLSFLNQTMALDVSARDAARLEERTEGWIAGLKMAALSMRGRDVRGFVDAFSGNHRYIADYLVEEVLQSESDLVRRFLLGTAMLDRLSGPLCEAVTGEREAQALLDTLERRNLFVVALDDRREWFRYHHLFAEVLRRQAVSTNPSGVRECHQRASGWFEARGAFGDAVHHAIDAADFERAADLLERAWPERNRSYESAKWLSRVKALPHDVLRARPMLGTGYVWALLNAGELETAERQLGEVDAWLQAPEPSDVALDDQRRRSLTTELAAARVYLAQSFGEVSRTLEHAKRALELVPEADHPARATGTALVALALWGSGDLEQAYGTFSDALEMMRSAGLVLDAIRGTFVLGDIRVVQGRLRHAERIYSRGLQLATETPHGTAPETDELNLGLSELCSEWNDLERARGFLDAVTRATAQSKHTVNKLRWHTAMARIQAARGELDAALESLDEAERHERRDPIPRVRPIRAMRARVLLMLGRVDETVAWAAQANVSTGDEPSYLREFEHITFARILIARAGNDDAVVFLERLQTAARIGGRMGSLIEILVLQSLALHARGTMRGALDALAQALELAESEGYLRVFLDHGTSMRELLRQATARGLAGEYTRHVLMAFDSPKPAAPSNEKANAGAQPLTPRELEILRLIAAGMRNQDIADHLSISAPTVKRHIANAYGKLGAGHRTEALVRAKELKLL